MSQRSGFLHTLVALSWAFLCGCVATFGEDHYFQRTSGDTGRPINFYRLRVRGHAWCSNAKYIAGYYDERAVDLFFNELKLAPARKPEGEPETPDLFPDDRKDPGTEDVIKPLSPDAEHGTFVMVLSTDASVVADTIGQFAENQVVAEAITNIVNRDLLVDLAEAEASPSFEKAQAKAFAAELVGLYGSLPTGTDLNEDATTRPLLRILNAIGRAQGNFTPFATLDEAEAWFAERREGN